MARFNPRNLRLANAHKNAGKQLASNSSSLGSQLIARILAVRTSWVLVLALTPVWFMILAVWILSLIFIFAATATSLATSYFSFLPLKWLTDTSDGAALIFILLAWVLHLLTFIIAFIAYWVSGVKCTGMWALNILIILVAASVIPGLQLVPWVFLYMLAIVLLQTGKKSTW